MNPENQRDESRQPEMPQQLETQQPSTVAPLETAVPGPAEQSQLAPVAPAVSTAAPPAPPVPPAPPALPVQTTPVVETTAAASTWSSAPEVEAQRRYYEPHPHPQHAAPEHAASERTVSERTDANAQAQQVAGTAAGASPAAPATASATASAAGAAVAGSATAAGSTPPQAAAAFTQPEPRKSRAPLYAGLSVCALVAGLIGGAIGAYTVTAASTAGASSGAGGGVIELVNTETATDVSAIAAARTQSVVTLEVTSASNAGSGSGVIYSEDGYIITNAHVIAPDGNLDANIRVRLSDGELLDAKLVGADPYADLAVVKVERTGLTPMPVSDSTQLNVGDLTVAIGAPLELPSTVTSGVISAVNRGIAVSSSLIEDAPQQPETSPDQQWQFETPGNQTQPAVSNRVTLPVIQTDASVNPGNSGGALLNGKGELIGINVAIASTGSAANGGTAGSVGLGFAIPSNLVVRVVDDIIAGNTPTHGLLGANVSDAANSATATHAGGLIAGVTPGSAAEQAGLKEGDIITAVDRIAAADGTSVSALVRMHEGGSTVTIEYIRDGKRGEVEVKLQSLKA